MTLTDFIVEPIPDCTHDRPIRLVCTRSGYRFWLTADDAWELAGELTRAVIEVRKPLAGFTVEGLA